MAVAKIKVARPAWPLRDVLTTQESRSLVELSVHARLRALITPTSSLALWDDRRTACAKESREGGDDKIIGQSNFSLTQHR